MSCAIFPVGDDLSGRRTMSHYRDIDGKTERPRGFRILMLTICPITPPFNTRDGQYHIYSGNNKWNNWNNFSDSFLSLVSIVFTDQHGSFFSVPAFHLYPQPQQQSLQHLSHIVCMLHWTLQVNCNGLNCLVDMTSSGYKEPTKRI